MTRRACLCAPLLAVGALNTSGTASAADLRPPTPTLAALRGRVVMLFYWSSGCPVCLDQWPELRANAKGWLRHPFTLVAVNTDPTPGPWREHERLMVLLRTQAPNVLSLWQGELDPSLAAAGSLRRLPLTRVLDRQGREVSRVEGRVAPEAWDDVAALLP